MAESDTEFSPMEYGRLCEREDSRMPLCSSTATTSKGTGEAMSEPGSVSRGSMWGGHGRTWGGVASYSDTDESKTDR